MERLALAQGKLPLRVRADPYVLKPPASNNAPAASWRGEARSGGTELGQHCGQQSEGRFPRLCGSLAGHAALASPGFTAGASGLGSAAAPAII